MKRASKPIIKLSETTKLKRIFRKYGVRTVCEESRCPNQSECFSKGTATFLILGDNCTRNCAFCNIERKKPLPLDPLEPFRILKVVKSLNLKYVVITSVTRDDLPDGGAQQFARCIRLLRENIPSVKVEVLIPDFRGNEKSLKMVLEENPYVLNHNIETVHRLYPKVRKGADYIRSLGILKKSKELAPNILTKSALILGLGEKKEEIVQVLEDLREVNCDFLVIGQYYQPSLKHYPVVKYYSEEEFKDIEKIALSMGFKFVISKPTARSSYLAKDFNNFYEDPAKRIS